jgi:KDO2-lipid IV(A) lauroyltransferase
MVRLPEQPLLTLSIAGEYHSVFGKTLLAKYLLGHSLRKTANRSPLLRWVLQATDLLCIGVPLTLLSWLSADQASALGRRFFAWLGPRLAKSQVIRKNLQLAFPEKSAREIDTLVSRIWGNAGAVFTEYAHLDVICIHEAEQRLQIEVAEEIETFRNPARPSIFVAAHQANWEIVPATTLKYGFPLAVVFTEPDNPWIAKRMAAWRKVLDFQMLPRDDSMRPMIRAINEGRSIGIIMDRRVDSGKPIPFFGMDKWTTLVPAKLALRYDCQLVPVKVERLQNCRFKVRFFPPIKPDNTLKDENSQAIQMTTQINRYFEQWIRANPQDWFCSARLWPKQLQTTPGPASTNLDDIHSNAA